MSTPPVNEVGGIILCGGKSSRMGRPKAILSFGPESMLERTVRILLDVVSPVAVVAAAGQPLPRLPREVLVLRDEVDALGPMGGLAVGLSALRKRVEAAYVSGCDTPFLKPAFIRFLIQSLGDHDLAIPREGKYYHPLAAVYRTRLEDNVRALIAAGRFRPVFLRESADAVDIHVDQLRLVDPQLQSLRNVNAAEDYQAALKEAGFHAAAGLKCPPSDDNGSSFHEGQ